MRRLVPRGALILGLFPAACAAFAPKIVLDERGVRTAETTGPSTINLFNAHYHALYDRAFGKAPQGGDSGPGVTPFTLAKEGAGLAYQFCSSFFKTAGTEQQYLIFSRDVIGVIGTLATGILGATHGSPAATAWVGIGSGAGLSAISIYSKNFLFSEDNVQAVQDLTLKAMTAQTTAVLARANKIGPDYSFFDSVQDIMDIQAICEVQKILSLVRSSIHQAEPVATPSRGGQISTDVGPQRAVLISGVNTSPAAVYLQSKDIRDVRAAVQRLDSLDSYDDPPNTDFGTASGVVTWLNNRDSDPRHLADVARSLGWKGGT